MKWTSKGHQFDDLGMLLKDKNQVYIYGAALKGGKLFELLRSCNKWLNWEIAFVDADKCKQKDGYLGTQVLSPEELFNSPKENHFVIVAASPFNTVEITDILLKNGYVSDFNCFAYEKFMNFILPIHFVYNYDMVFFSSQSILPSTVCNLNCESCLNFNPYIKNHITDDFELVKNDIDSFFTAIDYIDRFQITGGEPFLYKELGNLISYIEENYRDKIFNLETVTNGSVIPSDELCKILKENDVHVILDDYRNALKDGDKKFNEIMNKFNEYGIQYTPNFVTEWFNIYPKGIDHSNWSKKELIDHYDACNNPFSTIRDKKIYACNYAHYAEKAGLIVENSNDYFDLSKFTPKMKKELVEFRLGYTNEGYVDFCKTCAGWVSINKNMVPDAKQIKRNNA
jgi:hypothetical protein